MRDNIKDAKYYEDYLAQNMKRITRFQEQLKTLENDNVIGRRGCAAFIGCLYWSRICALYSSEASIRDIEEIYPLFLEYLVQGVMPAEGYFDIIDALSLGGSFGCKRQPSCIEIDRTANQFISWRILDDYGYKQFFRVIILRLCFMVRMQDIIAL